MNRIVGRTHYFLKEIIERASAGVNLAICCSSLSRARAINQTLQVMVAGIEGAIWKGEMSDIEKELKEIGTPFEANSVCHIAVDFGNGGKISLISEGRAYKMGY